ncbi:MAG: nucleoside hydrolase, partial [Candidatus Acidiferrales bacterium]
MLKTKFKTARILVFASVAAVFQFAGTVATPALAQTPKRVIIDTDPGTDDALAILLALNSPEVRVEAVTVVAGNVLAPVGLDNALGITSLAGRCDIPVA